VAGQVSAVKQHAGVGIVSTMFDIRNRDVEARGAYDPRYDVHRSAYINEKPVTSVPSVSVSSVQPGKVETVQEVTLTAPEPATASVTPTLEESIPTEFNINNALYFGDSIATGLGHSGQKGTDKSDAQWGRGAHTNLELMRARPDGTFKGKDIVLSSGILNSGTWENVSSQIELLQNRGANSIRLVGAPKYNKRFAGYNDRLQDIAKKYGITFLGGYDARNTDNVHPNYSTYPTYRK
jgi:hypothetical protein